MIIISYIMSEINQLNQDHGKILKFGKLRTCVEYNGNEGDCKLDPRCSYRPKTNKCRFKRFEKMEMIGINTPKKNLIINKYKSLLYDNLFYNEYTIQFYGYYLLLKYFNKTHDNQLTIDDQISEYDKYSFDNDDLLNFYRILECDKKTMLTKIIKEINSNLNFMELIKIIENVFDSETNYTSDDNLDIGELLVNNNEKYVYYDLDKLKQSNCNTYNNMTQCRNDNRCVYRNNHCVYKKNYKLKQYDKLTAKQLNEIYANKANLIDKLFKNSRSLKIFMYNVIYQIYYNSRNKDSDDQISDQFIKNIKTSLYYDQSKSKILKIISTNEDFKNIVKIINNVEFDQDQISDISVHGFDSDLDQQI